MWKLHRYYLKEVLVNAAITFLVLFAVVLVSSVYRGISKAQGGGPFEAMLLVILYAFDSFQHLLTISFLLATVMTFTRAAQDRELTAIRAAGISPRAPMAAAMLVGFMLTAVGSLAVHYVIPEVHFRKYHFIAGIVRNATVNLGLGSDRIRHGNFVMTFQGHEGEQFRQCVLYLPPRALRGFTSPILFVDCVTIPKITKDSTAISIVLDGIVDPMGQIQAGHSTFDIPIDELNEGTRRQDRDEDLRSDQLLAEVLRGVHDRPFGAIYTLFRRACFSLMPALFAPIGYCIAEWAGERGRVVALVLALIPLTLFYLGEVVGARLLLSTSEPAVAWMPCLLLALFGLPLCWRQLRR